MLNGAQLVPLQASVATQWLLALCSTLQAWLAATFWNNLQPNPLHVQNSSVLHPLIRALFKAFDNADPAPNCQKAITPKFMRQLFVTYGTGIRLLHDTAPAITTGLVLGAFVFAMRSCEFSQTCLSGRTKCIMLGGLIFQSRTKTIVEHDNPDLLTQAKFITVTFEDQKNGIKKDSCTQQRTGNAVLCPVLRFGSVVHRILCHNPSATNCTKINTIYIQGKPLLITNSYIQKLLRTTCTTLGGKATFNFNAHELGN
jgi:hypothetical protein